MYQQSNFTKIGVLTMVLRGVFNLSSGKRALLSPNAIFEKTQIRYIPNIMINYLQKTKRRRGRRGEQD